MVLHIGDTVDTFDKGIIQSMNKYVVKGESTLLDNYNFTLPEGKTLEVLAGGKLTIPSSTVFTVNGAITNNGTIEGKDVTVVFDLGNGIPVSIINKITGKKSVMQISLAHNGEFGFTATLTINMKAQNAGLFANLFHYNSAAKKLEYVNSGKIDVDGNVTLDFTHASDYSIVLADSVIKDVVNETTDTDNNVQTGDKTDVLRNIVIMFAAGIIILGACMGAAKKKEEK